MKMKTKTKSILPILLAIPLALASCGKKDDKSTSAEADKVKPEGEYPLSTCVVSGEDLGTMGKVVEYDYKGTTVKFCCKSCIPDFEADPQKFLAKLKK